MSDMILHDRGTGTASRRLARSLAAFVAAGLVVLSDPFDQAGAAQGPLRAPIPAPGNDFDSYMQPGPFSAVAGRPNRPDILDLEPAVAQAELILAVRLVDVTETKIVHGGRDVRITEQFRFEPVRVLKGIFAHESLLMTGEDLGIYRFAESTDRLARGSSCSSCWAGKDRTTFNCNPAQTLAQSIPRLEGKDEPLLGRRRYPDRHDPPARPRRAGWPCWSTGLKAAKGRAVAPLLLSLNRRALMAAQAPGATDVIMPHVKTGTPAIREVAARTLCAAARRRAVEARAGASGDRQGPGGVARERWSECRRARRRDRRAGIDRMRRPGVTARSWPG